MWKVHYVVPTIFRHNPPNHANQFIFYAVWIAETIVQARQIVQPILNNVVINLEFNGIGRMARQTVSAHCQSHFASVRTAKMQLAMLFSLF